MRAIDPMMKGMNKIIEAIMKITTKTATSAPTTRSAMRNKTNIAINSSICPPVYQSVAL
jgi:hypothetical protein